MILFTLSLSPSQLSQHAVCFAVLISEQKLRKQEAALPIDQCCGPDTVMLN